MASGDPPTDISQVQHVEEDSLASGDTPADMSQLQHVEEDKPTVSVNVKQHSTGSRNDGMFSPAPVFRIHG